MCPDRYLLGSLECLSFPMSRFSDFISFSSLSLVGMNLDYFDSRPVRNEVEFVVKSVISFSMPGQKSKPATKTLSLAVIANDFLCDLAGLTRSRTSSLPRIKLANCFLTFSAYLVLLVGKTALLGSDSSC